MPLNSRWPPDTARVLRATEFNQKCLGCINRNSSRDKELPLSLMLSTVRPLAREHTGLVDRDANPNHLWILTHLGMLGRLLGGAYDGSIGLRAEKTPGKA